MKNLIRFILLPALALSLDCNGRQAKPNIVIESTQAPGFNAAALSAALNVAHTDNANIHSILIERHGKLIAELYGTGSDSTMMKRYGLRNPFAADIAFDADTLHDVRSVSKSVTALLYGLAEFEKLLPATDAAVIAEFPELADLRNPQKERITFAHLLTMTSGLEWQEWGKGFITSDETRLFFKKDLMRFIFDRPQSSEAGTIFNYSGGNTTILAETLVRKTGKSLGEIARTGLFEPLGITQWQWATDSQGRELAYAGLRLKPRDMAKIGRLFLQSGKWHGRQLLRKGWAEDSLRPHTLTQVGIFSASGKPSGYGYQLWTGESNSLNRNISWSAAIGNGGQRIYVVPELDMVVVFTAGEYGSLPIHKTIARIFDGIIVAATKG